MITYLRIFLGMRNASVKSCRENQNKYFISITFLLNRAVYEISEIKAVEPEMSQKAI